MRWQEPFLFEQRTKMVRHGPEEAIAVIQIVGPFLVAEQIGLADLYFHDGQFAPWPHRHQIRPSPVWQWNLAHCEEVVTAEQASDPARNFGGDWRIVREAFGNRTGSHLPSIERKGTAANAIPFNFQVSRN